MSAVTTGKILWIDERHIEGQVLTETNKKIYFNYSVLADNYIPKRDDKIILFFDSIGALKVQKAV